MARFRNPARVLDLLLKGSNLICSNDLHRMTADDGLAELRRIHRLLGAGGKIVVTTPDIQHRMKEYVSTAGPLNSLCRAVNQLFAETRFLYDEEALSMAMAEAGFVDIARVESEPGMLRMVGFKRTRKTPEK